VTRTQYQMYAMRNNLYQIRISNAVHVLPKEVESQDPRVVLLVQVLNAYEDACQVKAVEVADEWQGRGLGREDGWNGSCL
jgi:hypothetical protein